MDDVADRFQGSLYSKGVIPRMDYVKKMKAVPGCEVYLVLITTNVL
jgi:hypothetical protein